MKKQIEILCWSIPVTLTSYALSFFLFNNNLPFQFWMCAFVITHLIYWLQNKDKQ